MYYNGGIHIVIPLFVGVAVPFLSHLFFLSERVDGLDHFVFCLLQQMGVCVQGDVYRRMAKPFGDSQHRHTGGNQQGSVGMPQVMDPDGLHAAGFYGCRELSLNIGDWQAPVTTEHEGMSVSDKWIQQFHRLFVQADSPLRCVCLQWQETV